MLASKSGVNRGKRSSSDHVPNRGGGNQGKPNIYRVNRRRWKKLPRCERKKRITFAGPRGARVMFKSRGSPIKDNRTPAASCGGMHSCNKTAVERGNLKTDGRKKPRGLARQTVGGRRGEDRYRRTRSNESAE